MSIPFVKEIKNIVKLSFPIAISAITISMMGIVDTMMVGNYNTEQLAYVGLATAVLFFCFIFPCLCCKACKSAHHKSLALRDLPIAEKLICKASVMLWLLGFLFMLIGLNGQQILLLCGQSEAMAENSGRLLMILALSIPGIMQFENANFFLQSIRRQHVAVYASVIATC